MKRLRGVIGMGLTWGAVWGALGAALGLVAAVVSPEQLDGGEGPLLFARVLGTAGFISGAGFALMLSLLERGRTIRDISMRRVALWGTLGGAVIPLLTSVHDSQIFWTCPLGALLATSTVMIARRVELRAVDAAPEHARLRQ